MGLQVLGPGCFLGNELVFDDFVFVAAEARFLVRFLGEGRSVLAHGVADSSDDRVSLSQAHMAKLAKGCPGGSYCLVQTIEDAKLAGERTGNVVLLGFGLTATAQVRCNTLGNNFNLLIGKTGHGANPSCIYPRPQSPNYPLSPC